MNRRRFFSALTAVIAAPFVPTAPTSMVDPTTGVRILLATHFSRPPVMLHGCERIVSRREYEQIGPQIADWLLKERT